MINEYFAAARVALRRHQVLGTGRERGLVALESYLKRKTVVARTARPPTAGEPMDDAVVERRASSTTSARRSAPIRRSGTPAPRAGYRRGPALELPAGRTEGVHTTPTTPNPTPTRARSTSSTC